MSINKVAFLGLGIMGQGMASNLVEKYDVTVWNRTLEKTEKLVTKGAKCASTPAEAVVDADLILYCFSNDSAVEEVVFGKDGVLEGIRETQIVADMSTVHPDLSLKEDAAFRERGALFLDAPVLGSKNEAANAGLWIVVGGEPSTFDKARPVFECLSETVHYMGDAGKGSAMKLVGNLIVAAQLEALGEAMIMATKAGLNPNNVLDVLHVTDFKSPIFDGVGRSLVNRDFSTSFALKHMLKDANLINRFAQDLNTPIPAAVAARETIKAAVNQGWGEENASALIKALELQANAEVRG